MQWSLRLLKRESEAAKIKLREREGGNPARERELFEG